MCAWSRKKIVIVCAMVVVLIAVSGCTRGKSDSPLREPSLGKPWTVPDVDLEMVWISSGIFSMGSTDSKARHNEKPEHRVTISKGFWMGKYEVTQMQWRKIMHSRPSSHKGWTLPVECVTWFEAKAFCQALTDQVRSNGRLPDGYEYRLPTEAEWEYACRAGATSDFREDDTNALESVGWFRQETGRISTHPFGEKKPNAWGLYDMRGNVCEWCEDWHEKYDSRQDIDPQGPTKGRNRVLRGGSYYVWFAWEARASCRRPMTPDSKCSDMGFRVVLANKLFPVGTTRSVVNITNSSCAVKRTP